MADLSTKDYKRFVDGIKEQYNNLLTEKETQLKNVEEDDKNCMIIYAVNGLNMICSVNFMVLLHKRQKMFQMK